MDKDITDKLIDVLTWMDKSPDFNESSSTTYVFEAIQTIKSLRQQLAEQQEVTVDKNRLVRELDALLNNGVAAKQASLCDIVSQVRKQGIKLAEQSLVSEPIKYLVQRFSEGMHEKDEYFDTKEQAYENARWGYNETKVIPLYTTPPSVDVLVEALRYRKLKELALTPQTCKKFAISKFNGVHWDSYEGGLLDLDALLDDELAKDTAYSKPIAEQKT